MLALCLKCLITVHSRKSGIFAANFISAEELVPKSSCQRVRTASIDPVTGVSQCVEGQGHHKDNLLDKRN